MITIDIKKHNLGEKEVLKNIKLEIPESTIVGLVGINGAGKSTLLRLLAGVYTPDDGEIAYDGKNPSEETTRENIFFLPDDPYYTQQATCKSIFNMYKTFYPSIDEKTYKELIGIYSLDEKKPIRNFSKGMRRQLYIAIALAVKPKYLLLDEAFDGLDPLSRSKFKEAIIKAVEENDTTVIISSHSLRELEDFCDRFILLDEKTVRNSGDIADNTDKLCKFKLAFTSPASEEMFSEFPVKSIDVKGGFVTAVFAGDRNEIREKLNALSPAVIEEIEVDFEEMFISEISNEIYR